MGEGAGLPGIWAREDRISARAWQSSSGETYAVDEEVATGRGEESERPSQTEEIPTIGEVLAELLSQYCVKFPRCRVTIVEEGPPVCAAP